MGGVSSETPNEKLQLVLGVGGIEPNETDTELCRNVLAFESENSLCYDCDYD